MKATAIRKSAATLALSLVFSLSNSFAEEADAASQFADHLQTVEGSVVQKGREGWIYAYARPITGFVELVPFTDDGARLNHRVLIPMLVAADGGMEMSEDVPAFLQISTADGPRYLPLQLELTSTYSVLTPADQSGSAPSFALGLASTEDGAVDWSVAPVMLDAENPDPSHAISYEAGLVGPDGSDEVPEAEACTLGEAIYDWALDKWDGISGGLASIGWDRETGSIATITRTLGGG